MNKSEHKKDYFNNRKTYSPDYEFRKYVNNKFHFLEEIGYSKKWKKKFISYQETVIYCDGTIGVKISRDWRDEVLSVSILKLINGKISIARDFEKPIDYLLKISKEKYKKIFYKSLTERNQYEMLDKYAQILNENEDILLDPEFILFNEAVKHTHREFGWVPQNEQSLDDSSIIEWYMFEE